MSKKRSRPLGEVIRMGLVEDGALLRYVVSGRPTFLAKTAFTYPTAAGSHNDVQYDLMSAGQRSAYGGWSSQAKRHRGTGVRGDERWQVRGACWQQIASSQPAYFCPFWQKSAGNLA